MSLTRILSLVLLLPMTMVHGQGKKSDQDTRELEAAELKQQGVLAQFGTTRFRPPQAVIGLLLSPDEKYVVTVSNSINIWDAESGLEVKKLDPSVIPVRNTNSGYGNRPLVFSQATGRLIGIGRQGRIAEYDPATGETQEILTDSLLLQQSLSSRSDSVLSLDISKDGEYLAVGSSLGIAVLDADREELWTLDNAILRRMEENGDDRLSFSGDFSMLRISPTEEVLAYTMSNQPKSLVIADLATGEEIRTITLGDKLVRMDFSPDGTAIAVTERDNSVRSYRVGDGKKMWEFTAQLNDPHENYTSDIAFEPNGKRVTVGATDNRIYILDSTSGKEVGHLVGHEWYPWALAFSKNRKQLYSSGWDGKIRRWDMESFKELGSPMPSMHHP